MCHMGTSSWMVLFTFGWGQDKDSLLLAKILGKEKNSKTISKAGQAGIKNRLEKNSPRKQAIMLMVSVGLWVVTL